MNSKLVKSASEVFASSRRTTFSYAMPYADDHETSIQSIRTRQGSMHRLMTFSTSMLWTVIMLPSYS